jgi:membrane-bound lytic murein transglycosylase D
MAVSIASCATQRVEDSAAAPEPRPDSLTVVWDTAGPGQLDPPATAAFSSRRHHEPVIAKLPPPDIPDAETAAEPNDLLLRLRDGFSWPAVDNAEVRRETAWFASQPAYVERVFTRAQRYLPHVAAEIEARGLPPELAFLPVVESAFDPFAYAHGRAAGLWQIIPGTGKRFGLKQNWWYDGRRDVVESTRAALDYLEYLHRMFDGDWLLAVAAYNCGEGTVGRAVRANRAAGKGTEFWQLRLPAETRGYVPRLLGLAAFLSDPERHGAVLPPVPDLPGFATVETGGQIDLAVAASLAGVELEELQALNPGFNRWATDPDGPHSLQVPVDSAEAFLVALAGLSAAERVRWHRHEVRPGDSLSAIARRYGTTIDVLRSVNGLPGTQIRAGSHLMVPTSTRSVADYPLSAGNRLASTQNRARAGRTRGEYTVRSGDSLWSIAGHHKVGVRELAAWNGMAPGDTLAAGRKLVIWQAGGNPVSPEATTAGRGTAAAAHMRRVHYTVRRGDSLARIAGNFRVTVDQIKQWNGLDGQRHLQPGQRLVLHVDVTAQSGG